MNPGTDSRLYILAFDHRGSFQKKFFGIEGEPDSEQTAIIADAKHRIFVGMRLAVGAGADPAVTGVLVDEQFGSTVPAEAREKGLKLAMPAERSGQNMFDFQYGDDFGKHIERFNPDYTKVLVRYNPDGDLAAHREQLAKLLRLSDWLKQ
ncbi:MAG: 2-deoxy-5-keto-D-gluconate 6-phosphate aldolase domain-containing protein, partial [Solirubrobacteraceae bacterium]